MVLFNQNHSFSSNVQESNLDFLKAGPGGDTPSFGDTPGIPTSQSKVTELLTQDDFLPETASSIPPVTVPNVPSAGTSEARIDSITSDGSGLLSVDNLVIDMPSDAASMIGIGGIGDAPSSMDITATPSQEIPIMQAMSPDITFPVTPAGQSGWDAGDSPAEVFGLEDTGIMGDTGASTAGLSFGGDVADLGDHQLVLTSKPAVGMGDLPVSVSGPSSKAMVQRLLSHDEQK